MAGVVVSVDGGTQLVQHSGMSHSIMQSTTNVWRGLGRRSHNSLGMAPENPFPERPIKPTSYAIKAESDERWKDRDFKKHETTVRKALTEIRYTSHGSGNGTRHIVIVNLEETQLLQKRYVTAQCSHKIIIVEIELTERVQSPERIRQRPREVIEVEIQQ